MTDDWRPTGRNDGAGHDGESAHRRDRIAALVDELAIDEKLRLLRGAPDPEGMATGYVSGIERLGIPPLRLVGPARRPTGGRVGDRLSGLDFARGVVEPVARRRGRCGDRS